MNAAPRSRRRLAGVRRGSYAPRPASSAHRGGAEHHPPDGDARPADAGQDRPDFSERSLAAVRSSMIARKTMPRPATEADPTFWLCSAWITGPRPGPSWISAAMAGLPGCAASGRLLRCRRQSCAEPWGVGSRSSCCGEAERSGGLADGVVGHRHNAVLGDPAPAAAGRDEGHHDRRRRADAARRTERSG